MCDAFMRIKHYVYFIPTFFFNLVSGHIWVIACSGVSVRNVGDQSSWLHYNCSIMKESTNMTGIRVRLNCAQKTTPVFFSISQHNPPAFSKCAAVQGHMKVWGTEIGDFLQMFGRILIYSHFFTEGTANRLTRRYSPAMLSPLAMSSATKCSSQGIRLKLNPVRG